MATSIETRAATRTVTVNAAFLQEIKQVNEELWQRLADVRYACSRPISMKQQCRQLVESLFELRDQVALHFALEEAYGYFEDPLYVEPRLCQRVAGLRDEHRKLFRQLTGIVDRAEQLFYDGQLATLATHVPPRVEAFYDQLLRHEDRENELIHEAMNVDIGVGD